MKQIADFAAKKDFPEANTQLLAGDNPNTVDLDIFRGTDNAGFPIIVSKLLLDDAMIETLIRERCLFLHYRATTHPPVMVFIDTPFVSPEEAAAELANDIKTVTDRLRAAGDLTFVSKKTTHLEAMQINMRHGKDMFDGCNHFKQRIADSVTKEINKE